MDPVTVALVAALSFALGMALNRGSTCAVLAVEALVLHRRPERFLSFFEASAWAAISLAVIGALPLMRLPWGDWGHLGLGAALFGAGAVINGACPFGVIGRLGSGQVEYVLTGLGLWLGMAAMALGVDMSMPVPTVTTDLGAPLTAYPVILVGLLALRWGVGQHRWRAFARLTVVMAVVGASFVALAHLHQPFPWVNTLAALPGIGSLPEVSLICLLAGSATNATMTRRFKLTRPTGRGSLRRLAGGVLLGAGAVLVPGGNDSLLLYGLPQGSAQAFAAYGLLAAVIAALILLIGQVTARWTGAD